MWQEFKRTWIGFGVLVGCATIGVLTFGVTVAIVVVAINAVR